MIKFCPNCGKEVASKFCPYCGCEIDKFTIADCTDQPPELTTEPEITTEPECTEPATDTAEQQQTGASSDDTNDTPIAAQTESNTVPPESDVASEKASYNPQPENAGYRTYYIPPESQKESVTKSTWFIILFLIIFWPLGLFFMWRAKKFSKVARIIITVVIGLLFVLSTASVIYSFNTSTLYDELYDELYDYDYDYDYDDDVWDDSYDSDYNSSYSTVIDGRTASEAVENYLNVLNFSRQGLIEQLEYEGYSTSEATAAVDAYNVDWNQQAAGSASTYISIYPDFTRSELIEQLEYEGYTSSQAAYAADSVGL